MLSLTEEISLINRQGEKGKEMILRLDVYQIILFFKKYHKLITIDLKNQEKLDTDSKAIQQIDFTGNLDRAEGLTIFFIIKEAKEFQIFQEEQLKYYDFIFVVI